MVDHIDILLDVTGLTSFGFSHFGSRRDNSGPVCDTLSAMLSRFEHTSR